MALIHVQIPASPGNQQRIADANLHITEENGSNYTVVVYAANNYKGDDETVVYSLANTLDGIDEYKILWEKSDY